MIPHVSCLMHQQYQKCLLSLKYSMKLWLRQMMIIVQILQLANLGWHVLSISDSDAVDAGTDILFAPCGAIEFDVP